MIRGKKAYSLGDKRERLVIVHCPGCDIGHPFRVESDNPQRPSWTWNGDLDKPTFQPSMLVNQSVPESRCHSFVTDGNIRFLGDCWHDLKNQTIALPELDEDGDPITQAGASER